MDHEQKIYEALEYIEMNLTQKIRLEDLAKNAYLSKYHYHRLFHKIVGESVTKYISKRIMARAASELIETDKHIIDIAFKYQFSSHEAFSRAFKKVYGTAPGEYRRQYTKCISQSLNLNRITKIHFSSNQPKNIAA